MIRYTFLGTGTSQGVPVIGCECPVCMSQDKKDKRLRTALLIQKEGKNILIDCGPDLRQQLLRAGIDDLEAILITHEHNDHIIGLDDVRPINFKHKKDVEVFCLDRVGLDLVKRFEYIFLGMNYPGVPKVNINTIDKNSKLNIADIDIQPIEVLHGKLPILGYVFDNFAYLTDVKFVSDIEKKKLLDLDHIVISALHHKAHHSHQNLKEALEFAAVFPKAKIYLTHFSHFMGKHQDISLDLPANVIMAYDGLSIDVD